MALEWLQSFIDRVIWVEKVPTEDINNPLRTLLLMYHHQ